MFKGEGTGDKGPELRITYNPHDKVGAAPLSPPGSWRSELYVVLER